MIWVRIVSVSVVPQSANVILINIAIPRPAAPSRVLIKFKWKRGTSIRKQHITKTLRPHVKMPRRALELVWAPRVFFRQSQGKTRDVDLMWQISSVARLTRLHIFARLARLSKSEICNRVVCRITWKSVVPNRGNQVVVIILPDYCRVARTLKLSSWRTNLA